MAYKELIRIEAKKIGKEMKLRARCFADNEDELYASVTAFAEIMKAKIGTEEALSVFWRAIGAPDYEEGEESE